MRFQQFTAPVVAKGDEDTAFYRYHRLDRAERGRRPSRALRPVAEGVPRRERGPRAALALHHARQLDARHQALRGRARAPRRCCPSCAAGWRLALRRWSLLNAERAAGAPSRGDEYHFYQALIAIWPGELAADLRRAAEGLHAEGGARGEAAHELDQPRPEYEAALERFVGESLKNALFIKDVKPTVAPRRAPRPARQPVAGAAQGRLARRARLLPGHRAVGLQPGRPRQPPAGRLRAARKAAAQRGIWRSDAPSCTSSARASKCAGNSRRCSRARSTRRSTPTAAARRTSSPSRSRTARARWSRSRRGCSRG